MALSIVIPAHNAAGTLAETLDSLLAQTRGDWTAIIVDDGSTDTTSTVATAYVARDKRFTLLARQGGAEGVSAARNRGIAAASGQWLLFLDADDTIEPAFVARMVGKLEGHAGAKVAYCGMRRVTAARRLGPPWIPTAVAHAPFEAFARDFPIVIHGAVLERAMVVEQGGFDQRLRTAEDMDFFQRIARTGAAFLLVPEVLVRYRMRGGSLATDTRAMLADTDLVIARGFRDDPRVVRPAARHAGGADPAKGSREMAHGINALWCAAVDIGQGGDGTGFVRPLPDPRSDLAGLCRQTILEGLTFGAHKLADELPRDDARLAGALRGLLDELEVVTQHKGLAGLLAFLLEPDLFRPGRTADTLAADRTLFVRQDIADLRPIATTTGTDRVHVEFRRGRRLVGSTAAPALGGFSARDVMQLALESVSLKELVTSGGLAMRPGFWLRAALAAARLGAAVATAKLQRRAAPLPSLRVLAKTALGDAALATTGGPGSCEQSIASLIAQGRAMAERTTPAAAASPGETAPQRGSDRRAYWEEVYRAEDPWAYGSPYEQLKYRRTLELLPDGPIGKAMELACSEGRFTELLAPRVGQLIASDISQTALERARQRCRLNANVEYRRLDLFDDPLPRDLDLVVCSEVLYDPADRAALARVTARLAAMLAPGGHLLCTHAFVLKDDPSRTGYDWESPFGAEVIAETLAATSGLVLERSLQTELYRIDLLRRIGVDETTSAPRIDKTELGPPPEPDFASHVVWGGATARRTEVQARETTDLLPILLYHRIAEDGPTDLARYRQTAAAFAEQMGWLRRQGYHSVTSSDVLLHLADSRPFAGRPVLITFDDGYRDFHDAAWPILRAHDFTAEVFVVTDCVGGHADWDVAYGAPAALMEWRQLQSLASAGVHFGSHMASHSHMAALSTREIVLEAARSRAALERALGTPCRSIAVPFGEGDECFMRIARQCGYEAGFTIDPGHAALGQAALALPRIEVIGGWSLDDFAGAVRLT